MKKEGLMTATLPGKALAEELQAASRAEARHTQWRDSSRPLHRMPSRKITTSD